MRLQSTKGWTRTPPSSTAATTPTGNPAGKTPPSPEVSTHWQCSNDHDVPPSITDTYFATRVSAIRHIVDSCSHSMGWQQYWSHIIE